MLNEIFYIFYLVHIFIALELCSFEVCILGTEDFSLYEFADPSLPTLHFTHLCSHAYEWLLKFNVTAPLDFHIDKTTILIPLIAVNISISIYIVLSIFILNTSLSHSPDEVQNPNLHTIIQEMMF